MKETLSAQNKEETEGSYDQFDTDDTFFQEKKHKKINLFSSKKLIKYILMTFVALCFIILLYNLAQDNNNLNNSEFNSNQNRLKLPFEKCQNELLIENELKFIENKNLNYSIKGTDITTGYPHMTLITVIIQVNNKCPTDNCFDCYTNQEINYPELTDEEAFHKIFKEMYLCNTFVKGIYYIPKLTKDNNDRVHMVWNKYKRKFISFKGVNYIDRYNAKKYNNEYLQAVLQGYEFTIIDHIYEKNNKNYYYNNKTLKFDEILLDLKCQRKGDKINYPELSDEEAFDKIYKEMELMETFAKVVYSQNYSESDPNYALSRRYYPWHKYYVWNNYKRKMILFKDWNYFPEDVDPRETRNEYLQSALQGYKFTFMEHIYEKDKKYYKYSFGGNGFYEIKLDSI